MLEYEFRCPTCRKAFTVLRDPHSVKRAKCPDCGKRAERVFGFQLGHIDWVNGEFHGEGINLGLGKHFKSAAEREYYAAERGLEKMT